MDGRPTVTHSTIQIRPVHMADLSELQRMCWPERSIAQIAEMLQRAEKLATVHRGLGVIALYETTLCGFGMLTLWPRAAEISDLFVNADYRSRGIGSRIITYLIDTARKLNVDILEIGVALSNPRALALYRRLGFADGRTIDLELGNGVEPVMYLSQHLARP